MENKSTLYNTDIFVLKNTNTVSFKSQKRQKLKSEQAVINKMQASLLFPLSNAKPYASSASTLVIDRKENFLFVCVPRFPLYYGYKMLLQINEDNTYDVVFDPYMGTFFSNNFELFKLLNFIHLPYHFEERNLLDSEVNKELKSWLLEQKRDIVEISESVLSHIKLKCKFELIEISNEILDFLTVKFQEDLEVDKNKKYEEFTLSLTEVNTFESLKMLIDKNENLDVPNSSILDGNKIVKVINIIDAQCTKFIPDVENLLNSQKYVLSESEVEQNILQYCEETVTECNKHIYDLKHTEPSCVIAKIEEICNKVPMFILYHMMECCCKHFSVSPLIYHDLDHSIISAKMLYDFLKKRNKYKQVELPETVKKNVKLFKELANQSTDISSYTVNDITEFLKFHADVFTVYPTIQSDTMSQTVVNRSSVEFMYYNEIKGAERGCEIFRQGFSVTALMTMVSQLFHVENKDIKVRDTFQSKLSVFPNTFWEYDESKLLLLNEINTCIKICTGSIDDNKFQMSFKDKFDLLHFKYLSTEQELLSFIDEIYSFSIRSPSQQNYAFGIKPVDFNLQKCDTDVNYNKCIIDYVTKWHNLCKEYTKAEEKVLKALDFFNKTVSDIKKLDVSNISKLYNEICMKSNNKGDNMIHFLSMEVESYKHLNVYKSLDELITYYGDDFHTALTNFNVQLNLEDDDSFLIKERRNLAGHIINIAYVQLFPKLQYPILSMIEQYLKEEKSVWTAAQQKLQQSWVEDILLKVRKDKYETSMIFPLKEIADSDHVEMLDMLRNVYGKDILDEYIITMIKNDLSPEWQFCQVKRSEERALVSKCTEILNLNLNHLSRKSMADLLSDSTHNEQKTIKELVSYFLALFVVEFMNTFNVFSLLKSLHQEQLQNKINVDHPIEIADKVLNKFPCYGLVHMVDVYQSEILEDSQTLKYQISVYRKIHSFENEVHVISDTDTIFTHSNQSSFQLTTPDASTYFNLLSSILLKFGRTKFSISLKMFELLISDTYWSNMFYLDLGDMQTVWSQACTGFRFKIHKQSAKSFPQLTAIGTTHDKPFALFKDINQHDIISVALDNSAMKFKCINNSEANTESIEEWKKTKHLAINLSSPENHSKDKGVQTDVILQTQDVSSLIEYDEYMYDDDFNDDFSDHSLSCNIETLSINDTLHGVSLHDELEERMLHMSAKSSECSVQNTVIFNTNNFNAHWELIEEIRNIRTYLHWANPEEDK